MNIKSILSAPLITAVFIIPILSATAVQAAEWHTDPGSGCHAYYGSQQKYMTTYSSTVRAGINMWVSCPVTSHGHAGGSANKIHAYAALYKATSHSSTCKLLSYNHLGNSGSWLPMSVATGTGYKLVSKTNVSPASWGNASVVCYLRQGDRIGSILSYN